MMHFITLFFGILFGLVSFNLFLTMQTIIRSRFRQKEVIFGLLLVCGLAYILLTYLEYCTKSQAAFFLLIRIHSWFTYLLCVLLLLFVHFFLEIRINKFLIGFISVLSVLFIIRNFLPYGGFYSQFDGIVQIKSVFGESVSAISGKANLLLYIYMAATAFAAPVYLYIIIIRNINNENRRNSIFLLTGIFFFAISVLIDFIIISSGAKIMHTAETGFVIMLLAFSLSITDRLMHFSKTKRQLSVSLSEKEILIKEIHHRVKNNLSILISLINLQLNQNISDETREHLKTSVNRLYSIARVHQMLYTAEDFSRIDLPEYLTAIVKHIRESYSGYNVAIESDTDNNSCEIKITSAIPLGLIVNEIVTNSFKHAFTDESKGNRIIIRLRSNNKKIELVIKDNGKGYDSSADKNGLGQQLIEMLAMQIQADLKAESSSGTAYTITINQ